MRKSILLIALAIALVGCSGGGGGGTEPTPTPPPPVNQKVLFTEFVSSAASIDSTDAEPLPIEEVEFDFSGATDESAYDDLLGQ